MTRTKTTILLTALLILASTTAAQEYDNMGGMNVDLAIKRAFCLNVRDERPCDIPDKFSNDLTGVCCGKECKFNAEDCRDPGYYGMDLAGMLGRSSCRNIRDGNGCDIPDFISMVKSPSVWGTCCRNECRWGMEGCDSFCGDGYCTSEEKNSGNCHDDCDPYQGDPGGPNYKEPSFEERMEEFELLSCLGVEEGGDCNMPEHLEREFRLTGVCCSGKCRYRQETCENKTRQVTLKPDLVVTEINVDPPEPWDDEPMNVTVKVENQGKKETFENFWIEVTVYEEARVIIQEAYEVRETIDPGDHITHTFTGLLGLGRVGAIMIGAQADENTNYKHYGNQVDEEDEGNNEGMERVILRQRRQEWEDDPEPGYCGDGRCDRYEEGECDEDCGPFDDGPQPTDIAMIGAVALIVLFILILVLALRHKKDKPGHLDEDAGREYTLKELQKKKDEIEEMTAIAKKKYHRRELDEESFREIVRDNQKKIIQLEIKIKGLEGRVEEMEGKE
ncbi:CARDB domain-containing protein [Candidatus Altiarchaeota archaeon]